MAYADTPFLQFHTKERIFMSILRDTLIEAYRLEYRSTHHKAESYKLRIRIPFPIACCTAFVSTTFIGITQTHLGRRQCISMTQPTTHNISVSMPQIVTNESITYDLGIGIHEEQPISLRLIGETVTYARTPYIFLQLNKTTVRKDINITIPFLIGLHRRGIIDYDDFVVNAKELGLLLQIIHQTCTVIIISRNEYRK